MSMDVDLSEKPPATRSSNLTASDRIAELNEIDHSIATLLSAASDAIGILSNQSVSQTQGQSLKSPPAARDAFAKATETYFSTLSSIEVRLRRQVYALEEANLIKPGDERDTRRGRALGGDSGISRVGGGPLDPSWLNARASDKVGAGMKRELLARARAFVEREEHGAPPGHLETRGVEPDKGYTNDDDEDMG
ncbi:mediator complex protein-domain-containing protein [Exophiala viscosa]|uniref:Mediator of RNA polymerase II transcription subunit 11 n=1 Tax=Exophiala viscosa TaxID=2486360 RepID=A0AAN6IFN9_9EURO|nr:mediator complex protein-domain-containing protein [Exophiala viscosa]